MWEIPSFFYIEKRLILINSTLQNIIMWNEQDTLANENKQFKETETWIFIHTWSDIAFEGTVVSQALLSLQEDHLKFRWQSLFNFLHSIYSCEHPDSWHKGM